MARLNHFNCWCVSFVLLWTIHSVTSYKKVYFDQISTKNIKLNRNEAILLKSSNQTAHLKNGVNATIIFTAVSPSDRVLIQTHTFATNCTRLKLYIYDGARIDKTKSMTGGHEMCGVVWSYVTLNSSASSLTMNMVTTSVGGDPAGGFNWTVMAYHTAQCSRDETWCGKGRCYPNGVLCDGYLSCSDNSFFYSCTKSKSESSVPAWVIAVFVAVVCVAVAIVTVVVIFIVRRKRRGYTTINQ